MQKSIRNRREYLAAWRKKNAESLKHKYRSLREAVNQTLGGKCCRCGFEDFRALQIDHILGGGTKQRKSVGFSDRKHMSMILSDLLYRSQFQLLCANCNWIKRYENGEATGPPRKGCLDG